MDKRSRMLEKRYTDALEQSCEREKKLVEHAL